MTNEEHPKHKKESKKNPLEELKKQNKELNEKYLSLYAEFENYRKRTENEMVDRIAYSNEKLVSKLLGVIDNFELAIVACSEEEKKKPFYSGMNMIFKNFLNVLEKEGLTPIQTHGSEFNPNHHEAIGTVESKEHKKDTILEVQKGYNYKDKVIRPAKVKIVK
ncbi:MAG: nucleotide exchange factor GrpE [Candidatus Aenigmarchaeota archaeon]|nr:nucleotide exchange factor GrpE [Candidatus Aenigmarchaeota archaeon]